MFLDNYPLNFKKIIKREIYGKNINIIVVLVSNTAVCESQISETSVGEL